MNIRLPDGMRDRIAALAQANGRSMNAEIVACLEKCLAKEEVLSRVPAKDPYLTLLDMMGELGKLATQMPPTLLDLAVQSGRVKLIDKDKRGST